jgi:2-polyprenyl-3-methyl-5-hydroxy-6-metoxy-1,4-benzoquinol methylase
MRQPDSREYVHDRLGSTFAQHLSMYDTRRRVEVLVDEFLAGQDSATKTVLDVGCGLGYFSERLRQRGFRVTSCDLGPRMVENAVARAGSEGVVADALELEKTFGSDRFDFVVSSECIEHTPDPALAISQMVRVLKPGGLLSLSTPNLIWWPVVRMATLLRLRPFDGYENFSTWSGLRRQLRQAGARVIRERGLHLIPFQLELNRISRLLDDHAQIAKALMMNLCILAQKLD